MSKSDLMRLNTDMRVNRIADEVWEIPASEKPGMLVPARVYATRTILQSMDRGVFDQVTNVACLPGIQRYALCMPDGHWGYGFPIGGVAAFDVQMKTSDHVFVSVWHLADEVVRFPLCHPEPL